MKRNRLTTFACVSYTQSDDIILYRVWYGSDMLSTSFTIVHILIYVFVWRNNYGMSWWLFHCLFAWQQHNNNKICSMGDVIEMRCYAFGLEFTWISCICKNNATMNCIHLRTMHFIAKIIDAHNWNAPCIDIVNIVRRVKREREREKRNFQFSHKCLIIVNHLMSNRDIVLLLLPIVHNFSLPSTVILSFKQEQNSNPFYPL